MSLTSGETPDADGRLEAGARRDGFEKTGNCGLLAFCDLVTRIRGVQHVTWRGIAALTLALAAVSCGYGNPVPGGLTGLMVNADGQLTMVAAWCGRAPDGVVVYRRAADELLEQADVRAPVLTGGIASMNLEEKPSDWSLQEGSLSFDEGQVYKVHAYSSETHVKLLGAEFTTESKKKISRGQVLIQNHAGATKDVLLTEDEFKAQAKYLC
ncbi:hypothetical protein FXF51_28460 [Nonomuraea sp. PA05]|uniref:hypothetical protein n=1 Tax=Nonomuraea sp. PA05 TaxID=2604466 RepID=UPI0011D70859|nr:hypothetical protein [Nonomuraea sp. PA05]TYB61391.1 hypothetical protein FXF51_28460 [Nonomuraea sp. PA05]